MTAETCSGGAEAGGTIPVEAHRARRPGRWRTGGRVPFALWLCIVVIYPVSALVFRLRYRHAERIPVRGPVLLVVNHVSVLDPLACARLVFDQGRIPHFLAKDAVFAGLAGRILRAAGQIPVARHSSAARGSLDAARADLRAGRPLDADLLRGTTDLMMSRVRDQLGELRDERPPLAVHPGPGRRRSDGLGSAA